MTYKNSLNTYNTTHTTVNRQTASRYSLSLSPVVSAIIQQLRPRRQERIRRSLVFSVFCCRTSCLERGCRLTWNWSVRPRPSTKSLKNFLFRATWRIKMYIIININIMTVECALGLIVSIVLLRMWVGVLINILSDRLITRRDEEESNMWETLYWPRFCIFCQRSGVTRLQQLVNVVNND